MRTAFKLGGVTEPPADFQRSVEESRARMARNLRFNRVAVFGYIGGLLAMFVSLPLNFDPLWWAGLVVFAAMYLLMTVRLFISQTRRVRDAEPLPPEPTLMQRGNHLLLMSGWVDLGLQVLIIPAMLALMTMMQLGQGQIPSWLMPVFVACVLSLLALTAVNSFLAHRALKWQTQHLEAAREQHAALWRDVLSDRDGPVR